VDLQLVSTELLQAQRELEDAQARQKASTIVSDMTGRFVMPAPNDFEGRYWERGKVMGYVLNPKSYSLLVVVPQGQAEFVRHNTVSVELRSVENVHRVIPAQLIREVPAATKDLPSLALALQGGGEIGLDPSVKEGQTPQALMPMFQFELTMNSDALPSTLGSRIYVRFTHDPIPLGWQWYRQLRELFMKRFEI
jgi:putative peptide zinc metalloprotease protein